MGRENAAPPAGPPPLSLLWPRHRAALSNAGRYGEVWGGVGRSRPRARLSCTFSSEGATGLGTTVERESCPRGLVSSWTGPLPPWEVRLRIRPRAPGRCSRRSGRWPARAARGCRPRSRPASAPAASTSRLLVTPLRWSSLARAHTHRGRDRVRLPGTPCVSSDCRRSLSPLCHLATLSPRD